ncbi:cation-transporting P-type ATPase [Patescibacteria group bacterium]|nr:cation-transporting P-type ATPase [Patescibacteria group bacterium]
MEYYRKSISQILEKLQTDKDRGLSFDKIINTRRLHGLNILPRSRETVTRLKVFFDQWKSPLIIILVVAAVLSGFLKEFADTIIIAITVSVNVGVGYLQENKANQALQKLRQMIQLRAVVMRGGEKKEIASEDIVIGDILYLEAGDKIQADGRIIEFKDFTVNESVLTGESEPVNKNDRIIKKVARVADRKNMVHRGTVVMGGRAMVVVTATGKDTEIGKIARLVKNTEDEKTPLQQQLLNLSKFLSIVVVIISIFVFMAGLLTNHGYYTLFELFETTVALAVSAIPESLVITLTVILAVSMQRILKRKALVRKLVSAETLGSVSVICVDKTGTLTEGKMQVTNLVTATDNLDREELEVVTVFKEEKHRDAIMALRIGAICNNSIMREGDEMPHFSGDTTETALAEIAYKVGLNKQSLDSVFIRIAELTFNSSRKYMATLQGFDGESRIYIKGAPEVLLKKAGYYEKDGEILKLTKEQKKRFVEKEEEMARRGLRVLAVGYKKTKSHQTSLEDKDIKDFIFVGMIAMSDPLRLDVRETLDIARMAGVRVVMITGDHKKTAQAIAEQIGLEAKEKNIFDGERLGLTSDSELKKIIGKITIFARVDPKDKIRIVEALKENGEVVAMTGDGVNDGPALKGADIGVALGSGTDVAKEISDLVLLDNRFSTIVSAIEEGRGVYQNIKKVVLYLLTGSTTEVFLIAACLIGGLPLAIIPAQILWVNIMEDSFPALALSFEKGDKDNMKDRPRPKGEKIVNRQMKIMVAIVASISNLTLFGLYIYLYGRIEDLELVRTIIFVTLGLSSVLVVYPLRSLRYRIWKLNPFENKYITLSVLVAIFMLIAGVYWAPLQVLLRTVPLNLNHWILIVGFSLLNVAMIEIAKGIFFVRRGRTL